MQPTSKFAEAHWFYTVNVVFLTIFSNHYAYRYTGGLHSVYIGVTPNWMRKNGENHSMFADFRIYSFSQHWNILILVSLLDEDIFEQMAFPSVWFVAPNRDLIWICLLLLEKFYANRWTKNVNQTKACLLDWNNEIT